MQRFKVMLTGSNFLISMNGETPTKYGFFTTRWFKAVDEARAGNLALVLVNNCPELNAVLMNHKDDPPDIRVESVSPVGIWEYFRRKPGKGYTFYPEDSD